MDDWEKDFGNKSYIHLISSPRLNKEINRKSGLIIASKIGNRGAMKQQEGLALEATRSMKKSSFFIKHVLTNK